MKTNHTEVELYRPPEGKELQEKAQVSEIHSFTHSGIPLKILN